MPLFGRPLENLTEHDLRSLIDNEVEESKSIDYKRQLDLETKDGRKEFLADVTAFANTAGGHLLIGVECDGARPTALCGISVSDEDQDRLKQRIENAIRDAIDPRLPAVHPHFVKLANDAHVLVIRVTQSWAGPHMVRPSAKFFGRNSSGKFHLDTQQLRAAFAASDDLGRRMTAWRSERIGKVLANETPHPTPLASGAKIIAHLLPQASFVPGARFPVMSLRNLRPVNATRLGGYSGDRPNLEGVTVFATAHKDNECLSYLQVFRNGCIESVDAWMLPPPADQPTERRVPSGLIETSFIEFVDSGLGHLRTLGIEGPVFACLTLTDVSGYALHVSSFSLDRGETLRARHLQLPDLMLDDASGVDLDAVLRPMFDVLWNAFGYERSMNYDRDGKRVQR